MTAFLKENLSLILAFVLLGGCLVAYVFTRDANLYQLLGLLATGFFALARTERKPQQTINAQTVENADVSMEEANNVQ